MSVPIWIQILACVGLGIIGGLLPLIGGRR